MPTSGPPSNRVLRAFRATASPTPLPGGQGEAWLAGDIVFKPAVDDAETRWVATFYESVQSDMFRLPVPIHAADGRVVVDGWQAWERLSGEHVPGRWEEKLELCVAFHAAVAHLPMPAYMPTRDQNPWVISDKLTFGELDAHLHPRVAPVVERLRGCLRPIDEPDQLIHGDFGGNILMHKTQGQSASPPAIIDMSAYYRPASMAVGVVIADAIVWGEDGDMDLLDWAEARGYTQGVILGELRRAIEVERHHVQAGRDTLGQIDAHLPLVNELVKRYGA